MSSKNDETPSRFLIIGIGNSYRSDDGAGIAIARLLREQVPAGVRVIEETGEGTSLLDAWEGAETVILVDAVHSGAPPGTHHRCDLRAQEIPRQYFRYSTHAFSAAEAIELARALNRLPPRLILHGIEGKQFVAGEGLSPAVEGAVGALVESVLEDVRALVASSPG